MFVLFLWLLFTQVNGEVTQCVDDPAVGTLFTVVTQDGIGSMMSATPIETSNKNKIEDKCILKCRNDKNCAALSYQSETQVCKLFDKVYRVFTNDTTWRTLVKVTNCSNVPQLQILETG